MSTCVHGDVCRAWMMSDRTRGNAPLDCTCPNGCKFFQAEFKHTEVVERRSLDTMQIGKSQIEVMTNEKERALCDKVKDRLIQSLLSYDEIQKLRRDAYNQGYNAGFHDATVEFDPNIKPLNIRGYIA